MFGIGAISLVAYGLVNALPWKTPRLSTPVSSGKVVQATIDKNSPPVAVDSGAIDEAKRLIRDCQTRFAEVQDYSCTFSKRELLECGQQTPWHVLTMKSRVAPKSFYFKYQSPKAGREAIYVAGENRGKALVHDVGLGRLLTGTLHLDPKGSMAMEDCRHPITEAGMGHMIDTVVERWEAELRPGETLVTIDPEARVNGRPCTRIESTHTVDQPAFRFQTVRITIDHELGLPTRFEAFDWPKTPGGPSPLVEEYAFDDVRLNVGLTQRDFDPSNRRYSFGRF